MDCPQCGASDSMGCVGAPGHACFLVLARPLVAEVERLRSVLERVAGEGDDWVQSGDGMRALAREALGLPREFV